MAEERRIETLEGGEHIRLRWSMYLDAEPAVALRLALRELWVNAADELTIRPRPHSKITISTKKELYTVEDNGSGIPADKLADAFLKVNTGSNFKDRKANLIGANGIGLKAVSHTAEQLVVISRDQCLTIQGGAQQGELVSQEDYPFRQGTYVGFKPLAAVYGDAEINEEELIAEIDEAAKFYPHITFVVNGRTIKYPKGLQLPETDAYYESDNVVISLSCKEGEIKPFANRLYLPQGGAFMTHFKTQLTKSINSMSGLKLNGQQIQAALSGYVCVYVSNPVFSNQQKSAISNKECNPELTQAIQDIVEELAASKKWEQVLKKLEREQKAEEAAEKARQKFLKTQNEFKAKVKVDADKLVECSSKDRAACELFVVEGRSAGGTVKAARTSSETQAIFSLRGKVLNVNKAPFEKVLENKELMMLVKALGGTITEKTIVEPRKKDRRYGKIIFMNDHDEDGAAIEALLLGFFYKYFPSLLKEGCLYRIAPALFSLNKGEEYKFFAAQEEAQKAAKSLPGKWELGRYKGLTDVLPLSIFPHIKWGSSAMSC